MKDGKLTTEFWVTCIGSAVTILAAIFTPLSPETGAMILASQTSVYAICRTLVKMLHALGKAQNIPDLPERN